MAKLYPPSIEGKLPAFAAVNNKITFNIPIVPNKAVTTENGTPIQMLIKTVQSGVVKETIKNGTMQQNSHSGKWTANFILNDISNLTLGQYYKIQIAYVDSQTSEVGYYSSVGVAKYTSYPTLSIPDLEGNMYSLFEYNATYSQEDINQDSTEKIYSYRFDLKDGNGNIVATSGDQLHNSENDDHSTSKTCDKWYNKIELENNKIHYLTYSVVTMNGLQASSIAYPLIEREGVDASISATLIGELDYDDACIKLYIQPLNPNSDKEVIIDGSFVLVRSSSLSDFKSWDEVSRFTYTNVRFDSSDKILVWEDFTVQHGVEYQYALQAYNSHGLYSNRIYNVNNINDLAKERILVDFEDAFLYDGERQLKIRFNPKISSFKATVLESKLDTIGGQFPFIFRNGKVNYKEFPISGLISMLSDPNERFLTGIQTTNQLPGRRQDTPSYDNPPGLDTTLTANNIQRERQFKMEVLNWLNNGKEKVFRSPTEGNFIVRLMNISLTPNDTLGRMLHTFQCTAYEIAEFNFDNLVKYNLINLPEKNIKCLRIGQVELNNVILSPNNYPLFKVDGSDSITLQIQALKAKIEARPGTIFQLTIEDGNSQDIEIEIGGTGVYQIQPKNAKLTRIIRKKGTWEDSKLTFSYETQVDANAFSYIVGLELTDEIRQFIGTGFNTNIVEKNAIEGLVDIRKQLGAFHYIKVIKRQVQKLYKQGNNYYRKSNYVDDQFDPNNDIDETAIYEVIENGSSKFYSGAVSGSWFSKVDYRFALNRPNEKQWVDFAGRKTEKICNKCKTALDKNDYCSTCDTQYFGDTFGRIEAIYDVDEVRDLRIGNGLILEVAYRVKTITYQVEEGWDTSNANKKEWLNYKEKYEKNPTDSNMSSMNKYYKYYLEDLTKALKEAGVNVDAL